MLKDGLAGQAEMRTTYSSIKLRLAVRKDSLGQSRLFGGAKAEVGLGSADSSVRPTCLNWP
jgi:hypothetical protein